eukprot:5726940-Pyramimonas_sp.AAC.1
MQLMLEDKDLPFAWEFDGNKAKLNDIYAEISTRTMTPHERAAFMDGKRKELEEFFGNEVWEFHKPTGDEDPKLILKAKWVLKWTTNDVGTPTARYRRHHLQHLDWDVSWLCYWQRTADGDCGQR